MSGRYFTAPLLASVAILSLYEFPSRRVYSGVVIGVLVIGLLPVLLNPLRRPDYAQISDFRVFFDANGISDERAVYFNRMGLFSTLRTKPFPGSNFAGRRWIFRPDKPVMVKVVGPLGVAGYQAGPNVHMIDTNALADPLMVRLPLEDPTHWRIGHFKHLLPAGYLETLQSGENVIENPAIREAYDTIRLVTQGALFDPARWRAIWRLNSIGKQIVGGG